MIRRLDTKMALQSYYVFLFLYFRSFFVVYGFGFLQLGGAPPSSRVSIFVVVSVIGRFDGGLDGLDCVIIVWKFAELGWGVTK